MKPSSSAPYTPGRSASALGHNAQDGSIYRASRAATISKREENALLSVFASARDSVRKPARPASEPNLERQDRPPTLNLPSSSTSSSSSLASGARLESTHRSAGATSPSSSSRRRMSEASGAEPAHAPRHRSTLGVKRIEEEHEDEDDRGYEARSSNSRRDDGSRAAFERKDEGVEAAEAPAKRKEGKSRAPLQADQSIAGLLPEMSFHTRPLSSRIRPAAPVNSPSKSGGTRRVESLLDSVPLHIQEALVLQDLLSVLNGIEGDLITFHPDYDPMDEQDRIKGPQWVIDVGLDPSLSTVLRRILPAATFYMGIEAFVDSRCAIDFGRVNGALASGLRALLLEYHLLLTQLETLFLTSPTFTLQKAFFHLHPTIHTLSLLHSLTTTLYDADDNEDVDEAGEEESSEDEDALALGLGGNALKGLMNAGAEAGQEGGGGLVKGGEVLELIWQIGRRMSGDPTARTLYATLFLHASQPYAQMLVRWVSSGHLSDKHEEFLVKESTSITKKHLDVDFTDEYWERRYTLRDGSTTAQPYRGKAAATTANGIPPPRRGTAGTPDSRLPGGACIPKFLEPWKHKILLAGKYLNVIRECGVDADRDGRPAGLGDGMIDLEDEKFHHFLEEAYIHANKTLLRMLVDEQDLQSHLRSLKYHFFLCQSSWMTHFLDLSLSEFSKASRAASLVKLQSLLELTLRTSGGPVAETYRDNVKVVMASQKLYDFLNTVVNQSGDMPEASADKGGKSAKGSEYGGASVVSGSRKPEEKKRELIAFEAFQLDYTVRFPLSLVISRKTIARYQILFRFLLQLRHAELQLSLMWTEHSTDDWRRRSGLPSFEAWKQRVFALRARMLAFVQQMMAFVSYEVMEPNWRTLEDRLAKVTTVDQMLRDHVDFLDTCLKEAGLTKAELIAVTSKLISLIQNFCHHSKHLSNYTRVAAELARTAAPDVEAVVDGKAQERKDLLEKWERNFDHNLGVHIERLTFLGGSDNTALLPLVVRLTSIRRT